LHAAIVESCRHAKAVELDFVDPLMPRRWLIDRLGKLWRDEGRKGDAAARRTGLDGPCD
jgi:hypothetical protein